MCVGACACCSKCEAVHARAARAGVVMQKATQPYINRQGMLPELSVALRSLSLSGVPISP